MTFIEQGSTGAFRATWRKDNPRSLLEAIIAKNPKANEEKIHAMFWREIEDDKQLLRACVEYWLDNNYRSLSIEKQKTRPLAGAQKSAQDAAVQGVVKEIRQRIAIEAQIVLLDLVMPNNKKLADCTGVECLSFGGWMAAIAKQVPATSIVSEVLSENDVRKLWKHAAR
jgi:hypothetical protein